MAIPNYQTIMLPLLQFSSDGESHTIGEVTKALAEHFKLTENELSELLPSGSQPVFRNRIGWAKSYLKQAGLLASPKRGAFNITDAGYKLLETKPAKIDNGTLSEYPSFIAFKNRKKSSSAQVNQEDEQPSLETPEDALASAYIKLRADLESELLDMAKTSSPSFFELKKYVVKN